MSKYDRLIAAFRGSTPDARFRFIKNQLLGGKAVDLPAPDRQGDSLSLFHEWEKIDDRTNIERRVYRALEAYMDDSEKALGSP